MRTNEPQWRVIVRKSWKNDDHAHWIVIKDRPRITTKNRLWWPPVSESFWSKRREETIVSEIPHILHRPRKPCCACDEAKYQLTFHGLWSKQTHPKDWPPGNYFIWTIWMSHSTLFYVEHLLHWSDLIGAVHTQDYTCKWLPCWSSTNRMFVVSI